MGIRYFFLCQFLCSFGFWVYESNAYLIKKVDVVLGEKLVIQYSSRDFSHVFWLLIENKINKSR